ncbi:hypothetical protein GTV32_17895 [Gordonia sp. SID5947]|uniref:hypothetical protein n=1 Tax=Gordonia sp. SID5947 TaxID=2690315 RepID=UPI00136FD837|nr:hypothetical protein [Gordonia sp. SID5947]MYR08057.1 hypothetical protein [Gordonia sp. SID5947]
MHVLSRPQLRPYLLAGVSLVSATAIAATPFAMSGAPSLTDDLGAPAQSVISPNVQLSSFAAYQEAVEHAITNLESIATTAEARGALPILRQILENQSAGGQALISGLQSAGSAFATSLNDDVPGLLEAASTALQGGDVATALNNALTAVIVPIFAAINPVTGDLVPAIQQALAAPAENLARVINEQLPNIALNAGLAVIGPVYGGVGAMGAAIQGVIDAAQSGGGATEIVDALAKAPAVMLDGLLNGGYGPNLGPLIGLDIPGITIYGGGLLGNGGVAADGGLIMPGTLASLQGIQQSILYGITPPANASLAGLRSAADSDSTHGASTDSETAASASTTESTVDAAEVDHSTAGTSTDSTESESSDTGSAESAGTADATDSTTTDSTTTDAPTTDATSADASAGDSGAAETSTESAASSESSGSATDADGSAADGSAGSSDSSSSDSTGSSSTDSSSTDSSASDSSSSTAAA